MYLKKYFFFGVAALTSLHAKASIFITEITSNQENTYVELFNSSKTSASMTNWKLECGKNQKTLIGNIAADSLTVIGLNPSFYSGDSISLFDNNGRLIDKALLVKLRNYPSIQRDSITLSADGKVVNELSRFYPKSPSKGEIYSLYMEDYSVLVYNYNDDKNELVCTFPIRTIQKVNTDEVTMSDNVLIEEGRLLTVYPNPVTSELSIINQGYANEKFVLQTTNGSSVIKGTIDGTLTKINMSHLASGVYLLIIGEGDDKKTIKVFKL